MTERQQPTDFESIGRYVVATERLAELLQERSAKVRQICAIFEALERPLEKHEVALLNGTETENLYRELRELNSAVNDAVNEANAHARKAGRPVFIIHVDAR